MTSAAITVFTFWMSLHPIHVSVTEVEYDEKDQTLEVMMRVFIDDLELTLRNQLGQPELNILHPNNEHSTDQLVGEYLAEHFRISLDSKAQKAAYLGHEVEGEALILYVEVKNVGKWNTITIHNNVIMSTYDDQSNIVHVYVGDHVKSLRLTRNTPVAYLTF